MIRQAIREKIAAVPLVAELCGDNVFWLRDESGEQLPCIVFEISGGNYSQMTSCGPSGPDEVAMAYYADSEDPEQAIALDAAIKAALHGTRWEADGTSVQMCRFVERLPDMYDDNEQSSVYRCGSAATLTYTDN